MPQESHAVDHTVAKWLKADVELGKGNKVTGICELMEFVIQYH